MIDRTIARGGLAALAAMAVLGGAAVALDDAQSPNAQRVRTAPQTNNNQIPTVSTPRANAAVEGGIAGSAAVPLDCACGDYRQYERVYALTGSVAPGLPQFARGRVISGDTDIPNIILVEWSDWFDGHNGGPGSAQPECPVVELEGTSRWWVSCDEIARVEVTDCACDGAFDYGQRVALTVDNPDGATGLLTGATGTVVGGNGFTPPILIQWDNWTDGHDGFGNSDCPPFPADGATNRWYVGCDQIIAIDDQATAFCACDAAYSVGDSVEIVIGEFEGADLQPGDRGFVVGGREGFGDGLILVEFVSWSGGHDGFGASECPTVAEDGSPSRWYLPCEYIRLADCTGDVNGDGVIDGADLTIVLGAWGSCP